MHLNERLALFPFTVNWLQEGESKTVASPEIAEMDLEFFDSDDGEAAVTDRLGRAVRLRIDFLEIVTCELITERQSTEP